MLYYRSLTLKIIFTRVLVNYIHIMFGYHVYSFSWYYKCTRPDKNYCKYKSLFYFTFWWQYEGISVIKTFVYLKWLVFDSNCNFKLRFIRSTLFCKSTLGGWSCFRMGHARHLIPQTCHWQIWQRPLPQLFDWSDNPQSGRMYRYQRKKWFMLKT